MAEKKVISDFEEMIRQHKTNDQSKAIARGIRLIRELDTFITLLIIPDRIGEELSGK